MSESIASNLKSLFTSNLFKTNNFIRIFKLLDISHNSTNIETKSDINVEPTSTVDDKTNIKLKKLNGADENFKYEEVTITYTDNTTEKKSIPIFDFKFDANFNDTVKGNLIASLINENILDGITEDFYILDPAGLNYMKGEDKLKDASGISAQIYNLFITADEYSNDSVKKFYKTKIIDDPNDDNFLHKKHANNQVNVSIYQQYDSKDHKINVIHTIGPNLRKTSYNSYIVNTETLLQLFIDIYDDIIRVFKAIPNPNPNSKLRLCAISSGIFAHGYHDLILQCISYVYINLWINNNTLRDNLELYIYTPDPNLNANAKAKEKKLYDEQTNYNYVKAIIEKNLNVKEKAEEAGEGGPEGEGPGGKVVEPEKVVEKEEKVTELEKVVKSISDTVSTYEKKI